MRITCKSDRLNRLVPMAMFATALALTASSHHTSAQDTQPARFDHDALLAKAAAVPLHVPPLTREDGGALSDAESARIKQSEKVMDEASEARSKGEYDAASRLAGEAAKIRQEVLGARHFMTVSAAVLEATMRARTSMSDAKRSALTVAERKVADARDLHERGKFSDAYALAREALLEFDNSLPQGDPSIANALHAAGSACIDLGLLDESELHLGRALSILESAYGENHPELARVLDRLGWLSIYQSSREAMRGERPRKSVEYFSRAIRILGRTVGETAELAESLDNRGTIQVYIGNDDEAVKNKIRALVIREKLLGPDAKDTGVSYSNLAWLYGQLGQDELVVPLRKKALAVFEKHLVEDHPYRYLEKGNLARDLIRLGKLEDGVRLFEEMHALDQSRGATLEIGAIDRTVELGAVYLRMHRVADAMKLLEDVYRRTKLLRESGKGLDARNLLARACAALTANRLYDDAAKFHETLIEWDDADRGKEDSHDLAKRAATLGALYMQTGRPEKARPTLEKAIERFKKLLGSTHIELASPMLNLARVHTQLGTVDTAERLCEEVLRISEDQTGPESIPTGYAMMWLGRTNALQRKYKEAQFNLFEAKRIFDAYDGRDAMADIRVRQEIAHCHSLQGRKTEAVAALNEAMERGREWMKTVDPVYADAAKLEILYGLIENTDASDESSRKQRSEWTAEFRELYEKLDIAKALTAEEREWNKRLGR